MIPRKDTLYWRRRGWVPLFALGALAALLTVGLSLKKGLQEGYDQGIQALDTGQVQIESPHGQIYPYFMVRAMAENMRGVVASTARLDFTATLTLADGQTRSVSVRASDFTQENLVSGFGDRVAFAGPPLKSGLVLSRELGQDSSWAEARSLVLGDPKSSFEPSAVSVAGRVTVSAGGRLDRLVYIDLGTTLHLMGAGTPVTSIALKLEPGVDLGRWITENEESFKAFGLRLRPWSEVTSNDFPPRTAVLGALDSWLIGVSLLASLTMFLIGLRSRRPRSGLMLLLREGPGSWLRTALLLLASFVASGIVVTGLLFLGQTWILKDIVVNYPFLGPPRLLFSPDPDLAGLALVNVVAALLLCLWPPSSRRVPPRRTVTAGEKGGNLG